MRKLWLVFILLLALGACKKNHGNSECDPVTATLFYNNQQVDTIQHPSGEVYASSISGADMVFEYSHINSPCALAVDADVINHLIFQVPAGSTSFDYDTPAKLENAKAYFTKKCYCADVTSRIVTGRIKGVKAGNIWNVDIDVAEPVTQYQITDDYTFKLP
jgi:hypothetical protein